jgi:hypothetical protein
MSVRLIQYYTTFIRRMGRINLHSLSGALAVVALLALAFTPSRAQVDLKLGFGIGAMIPTSDFSGSTSKFYNGTRYGLNSGPSIDVKAKAGLSKLSLVAEVDYSALHNKGNAEPSQGVVEVAQQLLSIKVGPEIHFSIPALPITPYIGANFALNRFTGETTFRGVSNIPSAEVVMEGATRFGLGFSSGMEVTIGSYMSLDFNVSYNFINVFGKEWEDVNTGVNQRIDSYLALNDNPDPQYAMGDDKHFISRGRNIGSILLTVGIVFSF